jgi:hypothetical protein
MVTAFAAAWGSSMIAATPATAIASLRLCFTDGVSLSRGLLGETDDPRWSVFGNRPYKYG